METSVRACDATAGSDAEVAAPEFDVFARSCPSRPTLEHVTGRWGALALGALVGGPLRFNELRRRVDGVSEKMLSQTLQALERDGLVHREAQPTNPPRVDYSLTALGRDTADRLLALIDLVESRMPDVLAAQRRYDERATEEAVPAGPRGGR